MATTYKKIADLGTLGGIASPGKKVVLVEITGDGASYPDGGEAITAAKVFLNKLDCLVPLGCGVQGTTDLGGIYMQYDTLNSKLKLSKAGGATAIFSEIAAADWTSSIIASVLAIGE